MTQRAITVPRPHQRLHLGRLRQCVSFCHIPHADDTLHQPYPRGHLFHTLLTPVLRCLDIQLLFTGAEQHLHAPALGERFHHPGNTRLHRRREQVDVVHLARYVTHHHHLHRHQTRHPRPHRSIAEHTQGSRSPVRRRLHRLPHPRTPTAALPVGLGRHLPGTGQTRTLLGLGAGPSLGHASWLGVVHGRVTPQPTHELGPTVQSFEHGLGGVSTVANEDYAAAGEPAEHFVQHLSGQGGTAGLALAG